MKTSKYSAIIDEGYLFVGKKTFYKDVRNVTKLDLKNIDVIVHLAGISNDPLNNFSSKSIYDPTRKYTYVHSTYN
jgi:hypothetical protein